MGLVVHSHWPLGEHQVQFTATQGTFGFCVIVVTLIIVSAGLTVWWKRRTAA
jgi:hypothetical protein